MVLVLMRVNANQNIEVDGINIIDRAIFSGCTEMAALFKLGVQEFCRQNIETFIGICEE